MTARPTSPTALAAETAAAGMAAASAGALALTTAWLRALADGWRRRRVAGARHDANAALSGLNVHLLRDIGAPHELIARHVEEIEPRALLATLEIRG